MDPRNHRPRAGTVAANGAIHDGEDGGMQLALHVQQIDQHLVHMLVRVVPHFLEQSTERILHRPGGDRMPVSLHSRQVQDLLARIQRGDLETLGEKVIQPK